MLELMQDIYSKATCYHPFLLNIPQIIIIPPNSNAHSVDSDVVASAVVDNSAPGPFDQVEDPFDRYSRTMYSTDQS